MSGDKNAPIVVWCGRMFSHDGYGTAARLHIGALREIGAPIVAVNMATLEIVGSLQDNLVRVNKSNEGLVIEAVDPTRKMLAIVHERPDFYNRVSTHGKSLRAGFSYCETPELPLDWAGYMLGMDVIWAGSEFNAQCYAEAGVPESEIDTVGHPVDNLLLVASNSTSSYRSRWPESTIFLSVASSEVGRRDLCMLYEAYATAFSGDSDVALVLKVPAGAQESIEGVISHVQSSMPARSPEAWPTVHIVAERLSREEMIRLHASADCYVSSERGDGWDLPAMDSLVLGIPIVATDFGASTTFIDSKDCYVVATDHSRMVACDDTLQKPHWLYSGQRWPYVDPVSMASLLKHVAENPEDRVKMGAAAAARMRARFERHVVAANVYDTVEKRLDFDFLSSVPSTVTVAKDPILSPRSDVSLQDSPRLARLTLDRRTRALFNPLGLFRPFRQINSYRGLIADVEEYALEDTGIGRSLLDVSRIPISRAIAKTMAVARLARQLIVVPADRDERETRAELLDTLDDYMRSLDTGEPSEYSPEILKHRREKLWRYLGSAVSTASSASSRLDKLCRSKTGSVHIIHEETEAQLLERLQEAQLPAISIGPGSASVDFALLDSWDSSVHVPEDPQTRVFIPEMQRGIVENSASIAHFPTRPPGSHADDQFSVDLLSGIVDHGSSLATAIQLACSLGFDDIHIAGADGLADMRLIAILQKGTARNGVKIHF